MRCPDFPLYLRRQRGISLIELVLGLALLGIVLAGVSLFFYGQQKQRLDPLFQVRAVSLAQALSEQIIAVKYDANNNPATQERCGIDGVEECANSPQTSAPGDVRSFNVVDDFHAWCEANGNAIDGDQLAAAMGLDADYYQGYGVSVCVTEGAPAEYKIVEVKVTPPAGASIDFSLHRYNIR